MQRVAYVAGTAMRETGLALDRLGCTVMGAQIQNYSCASPPPDPCPDRRRGGKTHNPCGLTVNRSRPMMSLYDKRPSADESAFVAPTAEVPQRPANN